MREDGNKEINNHVSKKMSEHLLDSKSNDKNKLQDKELGTDGGRKPVRRGSTGDGRRGDGVPAWPSTRHAPGQEKRSRASLPRTCLKSNESFQQKT